LQQVNLDLLQHLTALHSSLSKIFQNCTVNLSLPTAAQRSAAAAGLQFNKLQQHFTLLYFTLLYFTAVNCNHPIFTYFCLSNLYILFKFLV
jgi:hypothetical protein